MLLRLDYNSKCRSTFSGVLCRCRTTFLILDYMKNRNGAIVQLQVTRDVEGRMGSTIVHLLSGKHNPTIRLDSLGGSLDFALWGTELFHISMGESHVYVSSGLWFDKSILRT